MYDYFLREKINQVLRGFSKHRQKCSRPQCVKIVFLANPTPALLWQAEKIDCIMSTMAEK
jgi:hypothetical protein